MLTGRTGDTLAEAKEKLESMIAEYVYDALAGEDRDFGPQSLSRRAPLRDWLKYYQYSPNNLFIIDRLLNCF